tara:strand:- start:549 stop:746 length:198 start_codon:yes stop_codon:yes gene_type:complete
MMPSLTKVQDDRIRVNLFKLRYKTLETEIADPSARFEQALIDTADEVINLAKHQKTVTAWLKKFG